MNSCVYNILSIQNLQKYLKHLIQSMYSQRVKNKYPLKGRYGGQTSCSHMINYDPVRGRKMIKINFGVS